MSQNLKKMQEKMIHDFVCHSILKSFQFQFIRNAIIHLVHSSRWSTKPSKQSYWNRNRNQSHSNCSYCVQIHSFNENFSIKCVMTGCAVTKMMRVRFTVNVSCNMQNVCCDSHYKLQCDERWAVLMWKSAAVFIDLIF